MGYELRHIWQMETRRLLWVMGMVFAVVLMVQYFEIPNALLSAGKAQVLLLGPSSTVNSSLIPEIAGNLTVFDSPTFNSTTAAHSVASVNNRSETQDRDLKNDSVSERNGGSDVSVDLDEDGDPEDESLPEKFMDINNDSMAEKTDTNNSSALEKDRQSWDATINVDGDPEDESLPEKFLDINNDSMAEKTDTNNSSALEKDRQSEDTTNSNSSSGSIQGPNFTSPLGKNGSVDPGPVVLGSPPFISPSPISFGLPPLILSPPPNSLKNVDTNSRTPAISVDPNISSVAEGGTTTIAKEMSERPVAGVISISEMHDMLRQNRGTSQQMSVQGSSSVDQELFKIKSQIENAPVIGNYGDLYAPLYRNVSKFVRSYDLMVRTLKVYIYKEGGRPIFHTPVLKGIYASEGWFMKLLKANKHFVTKKPRNAHLFYLPFSSRLLEETLYVPNSHNRKNLVQHLKTYLDTLVARYPFWNRTLGTDHFLVACHDWAPSETKQIMANCIRALCNADVKEGFKLGKDVSLPETYVRSAQNPLRQLGGNPPSQRRILAFFAGNMHGYLRPILLQHWENKDPDMKIFGRIPKVTYVQHMKSSKYCICARGYEVNSPRVVEAIFYECVPVIVSDNFVPPFFEILNWESFAIFILEKDIPNLKKILLSIPKKRYLELQRGVKELWWFSILNFPCGGVSSSLLSAGKDSFLGESYSTELNGLKLAYTYGVHETISSTDASVVTEEIRRRSEEQYRGPFNDLVSEWNEDLDCDFVKERPHSDAATKKAEDSKQSISFKFNAENTSSSLGNAQVHDTSLPKDTTRDQNGQLQSTLTGLNNGSSLIHPTAVRNKPKPAHIVYI